MEDVGRAPAELTTNAEPATIPTLDGWIESLMNCKQLAEVDVQRLCEKVGSLSILFFPAPRRFAVQRTPRRPMMSAAACAICGRGY